MRVGLDATFLEGDSRFTGMGAYTSGLVKGLAAIGKGEALVLLGYGRRPEEIPSDVRWEVIPSIGAGRLRPRLSHQFQLPPTIRRLNLDVLHVPGVSLRISTPGIPFFLPCPLVVTIHDAIPRVYYGRAGPPLPWRLKLAYRLSLAAAKRAAAVITVSETSRRDIVRSLHIDPARLYVVHNGFETAGFPDLARSREVLASLGIEPPYLLFAGSFEPRKNMIGAVKAYERALNSRELPPLVILSDRESGHRRHTLEAIDGLKLGDRLHFVHSLSQEELLALHRNADLLLYPSFYEGFGFPPLLGLACGVPVIASDRGALPEILGECALYVDPDAIDTIRRAIIWVVEDPGRARRKAADGVARAAMYRWEAAARNTWEIYGHVVAQSEPGGRVGSETLERIPGAGSPPRDRWHSGNAMQGRGEPATRHRA